MNIADNTPVKPEFAPLTDDEISLLETDAMLSRVIAESLACRDLATVAEAFAEKASVDRVLQPSRWETFNRHMEREFGGPRT